MSHSASRAVALPRATAICCPRGVHARASSWLFGACCDVIRCGVRNLPACGPSSGTSWSTACSRKRWRAAWITSKYRARQSAPRGRPGDAWGTRSSSLPPGPWRNIARCREPCARPSTTAARGQARGDCWLYWHEGARRAPRMAMLILGSAAYASDRNAHSGIHPFWD